MVLDTDIEHQKMKRLEIWSTGTAEHMSSKLFQATHMSSLFYLFYFPERYDGTTCMFHSYVTMRTRDTHTA